MITEEIQRFIDSSVLCWLATISQDGFPSVSPKEAFLNDGNNRIIIANVASPASVANIRFSDVVCLSFIDVFVQKGFKIKGRAVILEPDGKRYEEQKEKLVAFIGPSHPLLSVIEVTPTRVEPIIAPSYTLIPGRTEDEQIAQALETYRVRERLERQNQSEHSTPRGSRLST